MRGDHRLLEGGGVCALLLPCGSGTLPDGRSESLAGRALFAGRPYRSGLVETRAELIYIECGNGSTGTVIDKMDRWDETWHRLREWTNGQGPSERLAAQVLRAEGYADMDPSHPLGGRDAGKDALVSKCGERWIMAVYFPRGKQLFGETKKKFLADHQGVVANEAAGMAFVTNQELSLSERAELRKSVNTPAEIFHLERVTATLDRPEMHGVREQFLRIPAVEPAPVAESLTLREILDSAAPTPGAPDHWRIFDGMLLLRVVAVPVPAGLRHPNAADPRTALEEASRQAAAVATDWPDWVSLLARRLGEDWKSVAPHHWGAGRTFDDADALAQHPSAAVSFVTRNTVLGVDRTWPTRIYDDAGDFAFHAAREPEVVAETLVSLRLAASLLEPLAALQGVDVAVQIAAEPSGTTLVSSERAVSDGGRFGDPAGHLPKPVATEVRTHYHDTARVALDDLRDPYRAADQLIGPWLATFRPDNLLAGLRDG